MLRIQDVSNPNSVIRKLFENQGVIHVPSLQPRAYIPPEYDTLEVYIQEGTQKEIQKRIEPVTSQFASHRFANQLQAGLGEAVMNAHVHGNRREIPKPIYLDYFVDTSSVHLFVEDSGGAVDPDFIPYLSSLDSGSRPKNFYVFAQKTKPVERGGAGIQVMYNTFDSVKYAPGPRGGLLVELRAGQP